MPYTSARRPDTGLTSPKIGIWLFLASETMLFGALCSAYALLRMGADSWPDQSAVVSVPLGALNTGILIASSMAIARARAATGAERRDAYRRDMGWAILAGIAFLAVKAVEYGDAFAQGLVPATDNFLGIYFTLTGLHALHVVGGIVVNLYLWGPGARMWKTDPARFTGRVEAAGVYWHFVDVLWIVLFVVLYLL